MEQEQSPSVSPEKVRLQNLQALAIILAGLFLGSLFVDFVQLATGSGFSQRIIAKRDVLVAGGKTWVAYDEPKVRLQMLTDEECSACTGTEALAWLRRLIPTMEVERVEVKSPAGEKLLTETAVTTLPAFIFSQDIAKTEFYSQAQSLFRETDKKFVFDMVQIGLPAGKYLSAPVLTDEDVVIGSKNAPLKLIVYSDFECEYCKEFHTVLLQAAQEFNQDLVLVFRDLPLSFHPRAREAAIAAQCAAEQNQFPAYAQALFDAQTEWGKQTGRTWFVGAARTLGLDTSRFQACLTDPKIQARIKDDEATADEFGITGTPSTFLNGTLLTGAVDYDILKQTILDELEKR